MTLKEIAEKIDKSKKNEEYVDLEKVAYEFEIYDHRIADVEQERLKAYWIGCWYCTDAWVGFRMYFLDDKPVAVSTQGGRKSDEEFEWFGADTVKTVREYILSLVAEKPVNVVISDIDNDIGDGYGIGFNCEVLDWTKARYNGEPFEHIERIKETPDYGIDTKNKIRLPNGEEKIVDIREMTFAFNLKS